MNDEVVRTKGRVPKTKNGSGKFWKSSLRQFMEPFLLPSFRMHSISFFKFQLNQSAISFSDFSNNNNYNQALIYFSQLASDSTEALHELSNASKIHWYTVHTKVIKTLRMTTNIPIAKSCFLQKMRQIDLQANKRSLLDRDILHETE